MPEICRFKGIIIRMRFDDNSQHHKPHVHAAYNEYEAVVGINGELLAGSLPEKELRQVLAWITLREDELYQTWNKAVKNETLGKIAP
jgi:hypothetical protein